MRVLGFLICLILLVAATAWALPPDQINRDVMRPQPHPHPYRQPSLQLAILLDTSNSMDNLIHQARTQLWEIVNRLEDLSLDGRRPRLEIALFEYGNSRLSPSSGYIRLVSPLTSDLDRVSEQLFALRTRGGAEFAPQVTQEALQYLRWSQHRRSYRAIVVAGNETFHQGQIRIEPVAREARERGVFVNTIFCGDYRQGIRLGWQQAARLSGGEYRHISLHQDDVYIEAPQDARIRQLNRQLNATYLAYGYEGKKSKQRQLEQDEAVGSASVEALMQRSRTKAGKAYRNESWDLVDAYERKAVDLQALAPSDLPVELRGLSKAEQTAKISEAAKQRKQIQQQIRTLTQEREVYLADKRQTTNSLQTSLAPLFVEQARAMGFTTTN